MHGLSPRDSRDAARGYDRAWTLALQFALGMGGCVAAGWWAGRRMGVEKTGALLGAAVGFLYILYESWKFLQGGHPPRQKKSAKR